ncbi:MAG: disulfide bond formation protein B [Rhodospirillales bacterium]
MIPFVKRIGMARLILLAILGASVGALATAYIAEFFFGLEPCPLCIYQRIPFALAGVLALLALAGPLSGRLERAVITICGLVFLIGGTIAVYHVGVEQHWWASATCGSASPAELTFEQMQKALTSGEPKACDTVDWQLFGISMAGYNIVYSFALAAGCLFGARTLGERP